MIMSTVKAVMAKTAMVEVGSSSETVKMLLCTTDSQVFSHVTTVCSSGGPQRRSGCWYVDHFYANQYSMIDQHTFLHPEQSRWTPVRQHQARNAAAGHCHCTAPVQGTAEVVASWTRACHGQSVRAVVCTVQRLLCQRSRTTPRMAARGGCPCCLT